MSDDKPKGWQRKLLGQSHYFDGGKEQSLCGQALRLTSLPITDEPSTSKCLVCFCKLAALEPQREMFEENE